MSDPTLKGTLTTAAPLADYTSWRVGGPATRLFKPVDLTDLTLFLHNLPANEKLLWLGLGSNLLVRDGGVDETVIVTQGGLKEISQIEPQLIRAEAGVSCATLARHCARLGLRGIEFLAGVPGTVGGALAMNAGCFGGETWEWVEAVETIDRFGAKRLRTKADFKVSYRHVELPNQEWFVAGYFRLPFGDKETIFENIKKLLEHRASTQPTNEPSCGSVFRNPPGDFAGRLIEACGLKGFKQGGAMISNKHANFIVNDGTATAADIESLIEQIIQAVAAKFAISLHREVHIIGKRLN